MPERSLRDIYYIIFRHKWKVILFFLAVTATVTLCTFYASEVYRSDAKLLLHLGRENVSLNPTATTGQIISMGQSRKSEINSELEVLRSRALAEKVVDAIGVKAFLEPASEVSLADTTPIGIARNTIKDFCGKIRAAVPKSMNLLQRLGLRKPLNARHKAVQSVMKNLDINVPEESNIISISYEAKSPKLAQQVVEKLINLYLEKHIAIHRASDPYQFFARERDQLRAGLTKIEQELRDLKNTLGIVSLNEQKSMVLNRLGTLRQEMDLTDAALAACKAKAEEMRRQIAQTQTLLDKEDATRP